MEKLTSIEQSALRAKAARKLVIFNSLADVPGTPLIKADGVKIRYPGFRLYAISRIPNFERAYTPKGKKTGGRYAVLFKEQNGNPVIMEIPWIVESEVQIILQQIGGFDPKKHPLYLKTPTSNSVVPLKSSMKTTIPQSLISTHFHRLNRN